MAADAEGTRELAGRKRSCSLAMISRRTRDAALSWQKADTPPTTYTPLVLAPPVMRDRSLRAMTIIRPSRTRGDHAPGGPFLVRADADEHHHGRGGDRRGLNEPASPGHAHSCGTDQACEQRRLKCLPGWIQNLGASGDHCHPHGGALHDGLLDLNAHRGIVTNAPPASQFAIGPIGAVEVPGSAYPHRHLGLASVGRIGSLRPVGLAREWVRAGHVVHVVTGPGDRGGEYTPDLLPSATQAGAVVHRARHRGSPNRTSYAPLSNAGRRSSYPRRRSLGYGRSCRNGGTSPIIRGAGLGLPSSVPASFIGRMATTWCSQPRLQSQHTTSATLWPQRACPGSRTSVTSGRTISWPDGTH